MLVGDVDGDGLADVITAWHCHLYGLVWWKQVRDDAGAITWQQHVILPPTPDLNSPAFRVSQLHALELVDMNGDGLKDILTGKRFWAHGPTGDVEPDAPAVVFWFELRRDGKGGASFVPHLIDDDSGVGTQVAAADLNGDGRPDVIVGEQEGHLRPPEPIREQIACAASKQNRNRGHTHEKRHHPDSDVRFFRPSASALPRSD